MKYELLKDVVFQKPKKDGEYECFHKFLGLIPVTYKNNKWFSNGEKFPVRYWREKTT